MWQKMRKGRGARFRTCGSLGGEASLEALKKIKEEAGSYSPQPAERYVQGDQTAARRHQRDDHVKQAQSPTGKDI